eukprot:3270059-Rhodomonas_salina.1
MRDDTSLEALRGRELLPTSGLTEGIYGAIAGLWLSVLQAQSGMEWDGRGARRISDCSLLAWGLAAMGCVWCEEEEGLLGEGPSILGLCGDE